MKKVMMKTKLLKPDENDLKEAGRIIKKGGLVAFPTETVYGLGANALDEAAVEKIYLAKGRPSDNPLILHVAEKNDALKLWREKPLVADTLMKEFWPGPLTIVMEASDMVPMKTRGALATVAVRMPENLEARKIIKEAGVPVAAPSANISGRPSPTKFSHVSQDMQGKIDAIVCGDDCNIGIESTVVLVKDEKVTILRPGYITKENIEKALKINVEILENDEKVQSENAPMSPGMKYRHYAPKAKMILFVGNSNKIDSEIESRATALKGMGKKVGIIDFSKDSLKDVAKSLFAKLREMDDENVDIILAKGVSQEGIGFAIMNRMIKSAGYEIVEL